MKQLDRNIKLIILVDGKEIESVSVVSILEQMEDNEWDNPCLLTMGNLELRLKRTKEDEGKTQ